MADLPKTYSSRLQNYTVNYFTKDEYHHLKREIFTHDSYYFETENATPLIIDAGAHIGLSTLYFKHMYPGSRIIAIEPNPLTFQLLEKNIFENVVSDVQTINAALASENTMKTFYMDRTPHQWWSTSGFQQGAWTGDQKSSESKVPAITLKEVVTEPVDMLKMDIEGAEQEVLMAGESVLPLIKHIYVEFHPIKSQDQFRLVEMLEKYYDLTFFQEGIEVDLRKVRGLFQIEGERRR